MNTHTVATYMRCRKSQEPQKSSSLSHQQIQSENRGLSRCLVIYEVKNLALILDLICRGSDRGSTKSDEAIRGSPWNSIGSLIFQIMIAVQESTESIVDLLLVNISVDRVDK